MLFLLWSFKVGALRVHYHYWAESSRTMFTNLPMTAVLTKRRLELPMRVLRFLPHFTHSHITIATVNLVLWPERPIILLKADRFVVVLFNVLYRRAYRRLDQTGHFGQISSRSHFFVLLMTIAVNGTFLTHNYFLFFFILADTTLSIGLDGIFSEWIL